jgi:putative ABC transport system permease protein
MALGAQSRDVLRMVLGQGMTLALVGVAIGLSLAAGVSRLLGSLLFGIGATDPIAFLGSAALFCAIGLVACYVPARRATEIEATQALRYE